MAKMFDDNDYKSSDEFRGSQFKTSEQVRKKDREYRKQLRKKNPPLSAGQILNQMKSGKRIS